MVEERIVSAEKDIRPYFKEMVECAINRQNVAVTDISQFYLVNLLSEFVKTEHLFDWCFNHFEETPLALLLSKALDSDPAVRVRTFKKLGDVSLYIAGYFSDHIDSRQVDLDYYISMGEGAYRNLSGLFSGEKTFGELYEELSFKFVELVDVLAEVRDAEGVSSNKDLIRLYEKWLRTGDPRIREVLEREGIRPQRIDLDSKNH